ncbi:cyclic pyranopterin monophosphate synthase MoaC [Tractidigestivibacter montrealensis]|uniref:cyclic pyranopterin monophosphate synthase MoaC n=3 Tax=Tractidigestivibacter TaxID=2847313 RepID=UPI0034A20750
MGLTHFNEEGRARMVDVSDKPKTQRVARAAGKVLMRLDTLELVRTGGVRKGDVLAVAQVAGIMAAKRCWELVPMCHPVQLTGVDVSFAYEEDGIAFTATTRCCGETGVEMEALTAASVAGLTIYDMCKAHQRDMVITEVRLLEKDGGKSGHFVRAEGDDPTAPLDASAAAAPAASELPHGTVVATCISEKKGTRKHPVDSIELVVGKGIAGDAHAGTWHRQVSLLANESVDLMRAKGIDLAPGDFAENVLTRGIDVKSLPVGTTVAVGPARMVVTQIGKTCHNDCEIRRLTGMCVMPTDGIFCVVTRGGIVRAGDEVRVMGEDELA